jgi:hypothetical protein
MVRTTLVEIMSDLARDFPLECLPPKTAVDQPFKFMCNGS